MTSCRLPIECQHRLAEMDVPFTPENLEKLALFCAQHVKIVAAPWTFSKDLTVPINAQFSASTVERALASWALAKTTDWSWREDTAQHPWRPEQRILLDRAAGLRTDAIGLIEGSTGIGKTRVFCAVALSSAKKTRVVIAVPTLAIGRHWQQSWALFSPTSLAEVWGKTHYGDDADQAAERQTEALGACATARAVLCTHQMIPKVLDACEESSMLFVDEAHLLNAAMAGLAGQFVPASALGKWLHRWCEQQTLPGVDTEEIELGGRMRDLVVHRLVKGPDLQIPWRASIITRQDTEPLIWLRHANSIDAVFGLMWQRASRALLFSGTLSWQSSAGVRSTQHWSRRLAIPQARLQDLGRVRPAWRDEGVTVLRPGRHIGADGKPWLGAYRGREETWWPEAARALLALRKRPGKSLVLVTSYADIDGIRAAMGRVAGVVVSQKGEPIEDGQKKLAGKKSWCWLATGAAWTGMDTSVALQRVVITKLPLPDPHAMRLLAFPQDAIFDAVSRFKQGIGRLVRAAGGSDLEIIILDGRINDPSPRWRSICQPFLQVLGEEFEHHATLTLIP